jgi:hypothetical protein
MPFPFVALSLATQMVVAVVDRMPQFEVEPTCRAAARAAPQMSENMDSCVRQERTARDNVQKTWMQFRASDRAHCTSLTQIGPQPSYVQLLTCLEIARDVENLPQERDRITTGRGDRR